MAMCSRFLIIAGYFTLTVLCNSVAPAQNNQETNDLLKRLEGDWVLDSVEIRGEKRQGTELPARFQGMQQTVKGDKMTVSRADGVQFECRLVVRGEAEPFELDIIQTARDKEPKTSKCIFKIVDQRLILADGEDERPKSFQTSPDVSTKVSSYKLKR